METPDQRQRRRCARIALCYAMQRVHEAGVSWGSMRCLIEQLERGDDPYPQFSPIRRELIGYADDYEDSVLLTGHKGLMYLSSRMEVLEEGLSQLEKAVERILVELKDHGC